MKAAVLYEVNKPLVIEDISVQKPGPREVLIRTAVAGLCHSDLHFMEGLYPHPLPLVPGHESAGVVEQVGSDVTYVKPGDHVVTCLSVFCGTCDYCSTGRPVLCTDTTVKMLPGQSNRLQWARSEKLHQFLNLSSFAEQMLVHENGIVKIRKDMTLELAAKVDLVLDRPHQTIQIRAQHGGIRSERCNAFRIAAQGLEFVDEGRLRTLLVMDARNQRVEFRPRRGLAQSRRDGTGSRGILGQLRKPDQVWQ